ncbi:MAG: cbb3-type cytochrome c oxidase subunit I [Alicyclobacillaceae bacterium]|jgi:cytochrome c oxidase subunit 1|uniref:cytochrome c oxidase subunit I n=1 Tax=Alicyclobacillus sp. SP_1 TaxID=2942475 RepID=UPI0021577657|nr:cbb3-type cytochrome c oxidase subunit I [Alicyclobacillus sp. SP_1]MCY0888357.1 cbb3-type cytochrome c oxidase subunit I [Alicyclobacillaceae bacterium]
MSSHVTDLGSSQLAEHRRRMLPPLVRGLLWAAIGFLVFNTLVSQILDRQPFDPFITRPSVAIGWAAALIGWLLGVGGWEVIVRPYFGYPVEWDVPNDWRRYFMFSTDHKVVGLQYIFSTAGSFFVAGFAAMLMRLELMHAKLWVFSNPGSYLATVGIHGTVMMFSVGTVALVGGFGNYFIPMMIGANSSAFPRLSGLSQWLLPAGVATVVLSPLLGLWDTGWRGYAPLSGQDPSGIVFYYLGVFALTTSSLMVSINLTATILFKRAPGLTWNRLPMYAWGILAVSLLNIIWLPEIQMTFVLALLNNIVPFPLFAEVGTPLTYMEAFWLFGHPEVYIIVVPAFALWQEIIPVMGQKTLFARQWGVLGLVFVMLFSGLVWAHHMFTNMRNSEMLPFSFFTEMISIPTGFAYLVVLGTLWRAKLRLTAPTLLVLMSMFNFLIGGITGVLLADPVVNLQTHDTFFVIAHFHYTIIGAMIFTWLAVAYYWMPRLSGRMYNEKLAILGAIWVFVGFNGAFGQMFFLGLRGMNRWAAAYPVYLQSMNFSVSMFAFLLGLGFLFNLLHIAWMWNRGKPAKKNPWGAQTLEWQTEAQPGEKNFHPLPRVETGFYDYAADGPSRKDE